VGCPAWERRGLGGCNDYAACAPSTYFVVDTRLALQPVRRFDCEAAYWGIDMYQ
jgi:hypothetical protein